MGGIELEKYLKFQLTPSRRATALDLIHSRLQAISTHALTEGDTISFAMHQFMANFNSRPHGGRRQI